MAWIIQREIWNSDLPRDEKFLALALANHCDRTGMNAYPSQKTLARETSYSVQQVRVILRKLERRGVAVEIEKPGRRTQRNYKIVTSSLPIRSQSRPKETGGLKLNKTDDFHHQGRKFSSLRPKETFDKSYSESSYESLKTESEPAWPASFQNQNQSKPWLSALKRVYELDAERSIELYDVIRFAERKALPPTIIAEAANAVAQALSTEKSVRKLWAYFFEVFDRKNLSANIREFEADHARIKAQERQPLDPKSWIGSLIRRIGDS